MTRLVLAVCLAMLVWWAVSVLPAHLVYTHRQRMLEDQLKQLEEVRRHEDEVSRQFERGNDK